MKTYKCPYCSEYRGTKEDLISHVDEEHDDMLGEGMTPARTVFNLVNSKTHGICVVCKRDTEWDENSNKYKRLCGKKQCSDALREAYKKNMLKVHGKITLLNDEEQQEKMLANRGISGKYKFEDGGYHVFTGSYEKKALEFMDKILGFNSSDIMAPGPTFEYEYKGEKHKWITDILLIPFNLVIEVKDGGSNPNNRTMTSYREKQIAKETMITNLGKYNYLRLTDNDFSQLLDTIAELKAQMIDDSEDNKKVIININEEVESLSEFMGCVGPGGMPGGPDIFMTQYGPKTTFTNDDSVEGYAIHNDIITDKILIVDKKGNLTTKESSFLQGRKLRMFKYVGEDTVGYINILSSVNKRAYREYLYEALTNKTLLSDDQILCDECFKEISPSKIFSEYNSIAQTIVDQYKEIIGEEVIRLPLMNKDAIKEASKLLEGNQNIKVFENMSGYFAENALTRERTAYYKNISDIQIEVIK